MALITNLISLKDGVLLNVLLELNPGRCEASLQDVQDDLEQRSDVEYPPVASEDG